MALFDFIFGSKKKEQERLRLEEEQRRQKLEQEHIARERERRLEENRRKEQERQARLKAEREQAESLQPFTFKSNCHQRYENGTPVKGLQECLRTVSVIKNTNGCPGYRLQPGIGYIVKIYNDDLGKPNMSDKPMKVVRKTDTSVELRGFPIEAQTPFGWQEVDYSVYGFIVYYKNDQVEKCILHMYDRNVSIEYSKKEVSSQEEPSFEKDSTSSNLFSKKEMEDFICILTKISYLFRDSKLLHGGRNETMKSRIHSYAGILGYYYEDEYHYGKMDALVDRDMLVRYALVRDSMRDANHKKNVVKELSDNWSDVLQVIFNMQLEPNTEGDKFKQIEPEIKRVSLAFEKMSGKKCKEPMDPRKITPRKVSYNPMNITEDLTLSQGHTIPDITNVFAQELIPQLISPSIKASKDIVADYALNMIKSYYDNAGFVPMLIVDQITGQINQVAEMVQRISYSPYPSLKEYVLSKIYK